MPENYFLFKAYTRNGTLIKTKPIHQNNLSSIYRIYVDMNILGVTEFWVTSENGKQKKILLKDVLHVPSSIFSVRDLMLGRK
jgi:hypothetical protein